MKKKIEWLIHFIFSFVRLLKLGGIKAVIAETMIMKQQLIFMNRGRGRVLKLETFDRFLFGLLAHFINEKRLHKVAVIIRPATVISFHKALVKRKYSKLYSNKTKKKSGRNPQDQILIDLVIEMKKTNPSFSYGRISMQIFSASGTTISRFTVGRILSKNKDKLLSGDGPSWLTFTGHMKDSLWSVDLFRYETIGPASRALKSHWVMVVLDQYTRRIIGFSVHAGDCDGVAYCRMFNKVIFGKSRRSI
jgi:putative transposase